MKAGYMVIKCIAVYSCDKVLNYYSKEGESLDNGL